MIARDSGASVTVELGRYHVDQYLKPLTILAEAEDRLRREAPDVSGPEILELEEAVYTAEEDVRTALSETVSIERAEFFCRQLAAAITRAKVARGDFAYEDGA